MQSRKFYILFVLFSHFYFSGYSQDNFVLTSINKSDLQVVRIKWYSKGFIYPEGINIYKKESTETGWSKLNTIPLKKGNYQPTSEELKQDNELKSYMDLVNSLSKLEGVALLGAYVKSFKSEAFSKYLGIEYIDNVLVSGRSVQYKVCIISKGMETVLGISSPVTTGVLTEILPPQKIQIIAKNRKTVINWLPETSRYYGVNIYRMFDSTGKDRIKVNKDPIIVSKTKNKKGVYAYPEQFFIEEKLKEDTTYYYSFKVIDFFGEESEFCKPIEVFVKDLNAPVAPAFHSKNIKQKSVTLNWRKTDFEKDFTGFHIYRAAGSGKEYTRVNAKLLSRTDTQFVDVVSRYGAYRYVIASIDRSGNEGVTEEIPVETIDEEPPSIPTGLSIVADTGKIILSWKKNPESDVWGYLVYQTINRNTKDDSYVLITPEPLRHNEFRQDLAKNSKNKFLYKVLAIDSSYNKSKLSAFAVVTLPDVVAPAEPFIFNCSLDERENSVIEFFKNTELDLRGYDIYRSYARNNLETVEKVNPEIVPATASRYTDRAFEEEGWVTYYMVAIDSANNRSKRSNGVKLNVRRQADTSKYEIRSFDAKAMKESNSWKLAWKINKNEEIFYVVYTKQEGDDNFEPQTKNLSETKFVIHLKDNTKTLIQVRAYTVKGLVAKSEIKLLENK